jgi:hypothetical protein
VDDQASAPESNTGNEEKPAPSIRELGATGAPPTDSCVVAHPGPSGTPVEVRLGPGKQFGVIGHLGLNRWAHALREENGWYQLIVGPGETGWANHTTLALNDRCPPAVVRIQFPAGETSATVSGELVAGEHRRHLFRAQAGQQASLLLSSESDAASFFVRGTDDGLFHKTPNDPSRQWQAMLPQSQDYLVEVSAFQNTRYTLTLAIDPLPVSEAGAIGGLVYEDGNGNGSLDNGESLVPNVQVYLIAHNCEGSGLLGQTISAADGRYRFANLKAGGYCVSTVGPDGYVDRRALTLVGGQVEEELHLQAPAGANAPRRINFPAGATATTVQGEVGAQAQVVYLFRAGAGQEASVTVAPAGNILFHLEGLSDGVIYKHILDGNSSWEGTLLQTQDYRLTLDNIGPGTTYTVDLSIVD